MFSFLKQLFKYEPTDWEAVFADIEPRVEPLLQKAVMLKKTEAKTRSFFGGMPNVSSKYFEWPVAVGIPLSLIAQLDLSEVNPKQHIDYLPTEGILLFFYDLDVQTWGFDPKDKVHFRVIYIENNCAIDKLTEKPSNLSPELILKEKNLIPSSINILPSSDSPEVEKLEFDDLESDAYEECRTLMFEDNPLHQLAGPASPVQGNYMDLECQLVTNGIYCGDSDGFESTEAKQLEKGADDWALLLQVDSDEELDYMWGDAGTIYFWIKRDEAKAGDFSSCWLILQCG